MKSGLFLAVIIFFVSSCASTRFPTKSLGTPYANPTKVFGSLSTPEGEGPFPAVVLLHTCGGLTAPITSHWPRFLTGIGYAVLVVNSYGPRGVSSCHQLRGHRVLQAEDAVGALDYLVGLPSIDPDRIGVMGFSAGAIAINSFLVNKTIVSRTKESTEGYYFRAAIALYGFCGLIRAYDVNRIALMEIVGEKDVIHAPSCIDAQRIHTGIEVHVLPGAYHAFDNPGASGKYDGKNGSDGSYMKYSSTATSKAKQLTKEFLAENLKSE
jgi:dienelactone hydrolase